MPARPPACYFGFLVSSFFSPALLPSKRATRQGVVLEARDGEDWKRREIASGFAVLKLFDVGGTIWAVTPRDVRRVYPRR